MENLENSLNANKGRSFTNHRTFDATSVDKVISPTARAFRVNTDGLVHFIDYCDNDVTLLCIAGMDQFHGIKKLFSDSAVKIIIACD